MRGPSLFPTKHPFPFESLPGLLTQLGAASSRGSLFHELWKTRVKDSLSRFLVCKCVLRENRAKESILLLLFPLRFVTVQKLLAAVTCWQTTL